MPALTTIRRAAWALVAVAALGATGLYAYTATRPAQAAGLGEGNYTLTTAAGETFTHETLEGRPAAVFFGFTHCPEVCPTTLAEMTAWFEALGDEADGLDAYFITVDPERDTADVIGDYVAWTGTPAEISKALKAWAVYAQKVPLEGGDYTMDHTASVFLVDRNGDFGGTIAYRESSETAVAKLRKLLES